MGGRDVMSKLEVSSNNYEYSIGDQRSISVPQVHVHLAIAAISTLHGPTPAGQSGHVVIIRGLVTCSCAFGKIPGA